MRNHRLSAAAGIVLAFALNACSSPNWQPATVPPPKPFDKETVLEFYANDQLVRLHGVQFKRDSLSGIPWLDHLSCDSCRVRYALADISQARTGNPGAGAWNIAAPLAVAALVIGIYASLLAPGVR